MRKVVIRILHKFINFIQSWFEEDVWLRLKRRKNEKILEWSRIFKWKIFQQVALNKYLALPLPFVDHVGGWGQDVLLLAHEVIKLVLVVVAADAAVLALDGWGRHDLNEVSVEGHPDAEEGVDVVGGSPSEDPEKRNRFYSVFFLENSENYLCWDSNLGLLQF